MYKTSVRGKLIEGEKTYQDVSRDISLPIEQKTPLWWLGAVLFSGVLALVGLYAMFQTVTQGIGLWGVNNTVAWGAAIINFVWWIGIGHAGTAFSIFLLIVRQKWRTSINRAAEAMTVFAVVCAGLFPLLHMGRLWDGFMIFPYPNTRGPLWVNFNSPLLWDVVAISTYGTVSAVFWYIGMIPDFATIRDRATNKIQKAAYAFLAMGWVNSARAWLRFETTAMILGGLAAPLVISVHSIVSMDFATSVEPGWHTTIFPPYFVIGAIFSGFAMVLTLMMTIKALFPTTRDYVTKNHLEAVARILVFISLIMGTAYLTEIFIAWYSGSPYEIFTFFNNRITGDYSFGFYWMFIPNAIVPQLFWIKKLRNNMTFVFIVSIIINIGMWFERYVIVVSSLTRDFLPSSWADYAPTSTEWMIFIGTIGIFLLGTLMFFRFVPMIAISEVKMILRKTNK